MIDLDKLRETVAELQRLAGEATPGPLEVRRNRDSLCVYATPPDMEYYVGSFGYTEHVAGVEQREVNAALAAAAVNAVPILSEALPALIAAAEAVQAWDAADRHGYATARSGGDIIEALNGMSAAEGLLRTAAKGLAPQQPRRYDRAGCDVTDLPGLWDESDTIKEVEG